MSAINTPGIKFHFGELQELPNHKHVDLPHKSRCLLRGILDALGIIVDAYGKQLETPILRDNFVFVAFAEGDQLFKSSPHAVLGNLNEAAAAIQHNATLRKPRALAQVVKQREYLNVLTGLSHAHAKFGTQAHLVIGEEHHLLPALDPAAFSEPASSEPKRIKGTFKLIGLCKDEQNAHVVVLEDRSFALLPLGDYKDSATDLQIEIFSTFDCWFEGELIKMGSGRWQAQPGGRIIQQSLIPTPAVPA